MILFDIFTFKKEAGSFFSKENFNHLFLTAREEIIKQIKRNVPGKEKMAFVNCVVIGRIGKLVELKGIKNKLVLWLIDKLIEITPVFTQITYDFLKEKIENL